MFQCSCISISSSKYKKDTFSLVMHIPFQLRSFTSSCPSGAFFRYSHFWLLYGFRIGSDRIGIGKVKTSQPTPPPTHPNQRSSLFTSQNFAPIWLPHWPPWMCTSSRMVKKVKATAIPEPPSRSQSRVRAHNIIIRYDSNPMRHLNCTSACLKLFMPV